MAYFHYAALYRCWANMLQRTGNPNNTRYADYGGRGIKVCERWADKKYGLDRRCRTLWMRYKNSGKPGAWSDFAQGAQ